MCRRSCGRRRGCLIQTTIRRGRGRPRRKAVDLRDLLAGIECPHTELCPHLWQTQLHSLANYRVAANTLTNQKISIEILSAGFGLLWPAPRCSGAEIENVKI